MRPRFTGACRVMDDVRGLAAFYARILGSSVEGDDVFAIVPIAGAALSFFAESGMAWMAPGWEPAAGVRGVTPEFEVDDVDTVYARLRADGVPIMKPPTTQPWGGGRCGSGTRGMSSLTSTAPFRRRPIPR